jgi:NADH dehydrogenase [ubiquinone] 1 alpha subcomplex assembly factor 7
VSEEVASAVRAAIGERGPIGFDEYMAIALYGPGGFFEDPPVGPDGHFVTAPHVHPYVFAHCVRAALLETWQMLGEPDPFRVVELGAGDGTLASALLAAFAELPAPTVDYVAVEISPGARRALVERDLTVVPTLEELEPFEGAVVANELLDNLPFVPLRRRGRRLVEVRVGLEGDRFVEVEVPWSRTGPVPSLGDGQGSSVPMGAFAMLSSISGRLRRGSALLIDYGAPGGAEGAVHGYRQHREVGDVLSDPGGTDITAGVDWAQVVDRARSLGFAVAGPVAQTDALAALGHARWEATMRERQAALQREGRGSEAVGIWEARSRASLLVDRARFGAFGWLHLSTRGLPDPTWISRPSTD